MFSCKHILPIAMASLLATACASVPSDPESQAKLAANLGPVPAQEPNDEQLSCDDLAAQIHQAQWDISALDLQINRAQNVSTGFAILGAIAGVTGAVANNNSQVQTAAVENVAANTGGAISNGVGMTKAAIRATYQARYDNLVGEFNGKGCPPAT
jgi:hypothetical protein